MAAIIRNPVKYIAELFQTNQWPPKLAIQNSVYAGVSHIFSFSIAPLVTEDTDPTNYWIVWGGYFDNPYGYGLQVYMDSFLTEVFLPSNLLVIEKSFYIDEINNICYMNIPKNPWRYFSEYASIYGNVYSTFTTAPKNESNLSDIFYDIVKVEPTMEIPSLENGLNECLGGVTTYDSFTISLDNTDGRYDGRDILAYFNTPLQISKSTENPTHISDFDRIRYGLVTDITVDFEKMEIEATDPFYMMTTEYCRKFTTDEFPNIEDSVVGDDIPVGWGVLEGIEPIEVDKDTADPATWIDYIALDKSHITSVEGVYDEDGNSLSHTFYPATGIIRVTSVDGDGKVIEAEYMNVTGKTDCNIGEIITEILAQNENLTYIEGIWDVTETDAYIAYAPDLSYYFDGGTTKDIIEDVLKNDIAFLIRKNDGRLTIRRWGETYINHQLESWVTTQKPTKNFEDATEYFCSTARVKYKPFYIDDIFQNSYTNDENERDIYARYRRSYTAEFETNLTTATDAEDLADRIMARFGDVRETVEVGLGVNTFDVDLLDTVDIELTVNDREFSKYSRWIVKKCDPGQDVLTMEGILIFNPLTFDGVQATLDGLPFVVEVN